MFTNTPVLHAPPPANYAFDKEPNAILFTKCDFIRSNTRCPLKYNTHVSGSEDGSSRCPEEYNQTEPRMGRFIKAVSV